MFDDCDDCSVLRDAIAEAESTGNSQAAEHHRNTYQIHRQAEHTMDSEDYDWTDE